MIHPLLVGVDVQRTTNITAFLNRGGQEVAPRLTLPNNRQDLLHGCRGWANYQRHLRLHLAS